jgi:hypothetical protein
MGVGLSCGHFPLISQPLYVMPFPVFHGPQTGSGTHPASYPMGTTGSSPEVKRQRREANRSATSSAEIKKCGAISSLPHMPSWHRACLIKHRGNFTLENEDSSGSGQGPVVNLWTRHKTGDCRQAGEVSDSLVTCNQLRVQTEEYTFSSSSWYYFRWLFNDAVNIETVQRLYTFSCGPFTERQVGIFRTREVMSSIFCFLTSHHKQFLLAPSIKGKRYSGAASFQIFTNYLFPINILFDATWPVSSPHS